MTLETVIDELAAPVLPVSIPSLILEAGFPPQLPAPRQRENM